MCTHGTCREAAPTGLDRPEIVMATGVIRSFLVQPPGYFPLVFKPSPQRGSEEELTSHPEEERSEEEELLEEEDEDEEVFLEPAPTTLDVTNQLLRFADLISRDIQRYFGRGGGDQDACDIYSDSVSLTTSGRLRYYDDLLKIAKGGSAEERAGCGVGQTVAAGRDSLGPLAELFNQKDGTPGRPMIKRALPLSFWTEPLPGPAADSGASQPDQNGSPHAHHLIGAPMDFSDLLAFWDSHPDLPPALDDTSQMQH